MTHDILGNASGFELLFLASALIGIWFGRDNVREAWADYRSLGGIVNGRRAIAVASILTETIRLSIHGLYIIAGLVAVTIPANPTTTLGVLVLSILVYVSWAQTAIGYINRRLRDYLEAHGMQARDDKGRFTS